MPIEVKMFEQVQEELLAAILTVLETNGITDPTVRLGTLIGAAVGYAKSQGVRRETLMAHVIQCARVLGLA